MSQGSLFLDTTIQIERVAGSRARQRALRQELAPYQLVTSTYVLGEYLRTLVKDAVRLHRLVAENVYLDDVMTAIGQYPNKREASRMAIIWGIVMRSAYPERNSDARADLLDRLSRYIESSLLNRFMAGIDELIDVSACGLAEERPVVWESASTVPPDAETYRLRSQCIRNVRECDLAERMADWQPELDAIVDGLGSESDPALVRMRELAHQIRSDPTLARGRNCTRYLGDLVIALVLPDDMPLYTTNRRHFVPLLSILGKTLYSPPVA